MGKITLACKLFGHKFRVRYGDESGWFTFCILCGLNKNAVKENQNELRNDS